MLHAGFEAAAVVLQLLVATSVPFMQKLEDWLYSGLLHDAAEEFFICAGVLAACVPD